MRSPAATRFVGGAARGRHRRALQTTPCKRTIMRNGNAHYIGATVDLDRRIEQHNASRVGGAHRTAKRGPGWKCTWYVDGFSSFQQSLQFEYALKRETRSFGYTPAARLRAVRSLIDRWTMQKEATPMLCIHQ